MIQLPPSEFTYSRYSLSLLPWAIIKSTATYFKWLLAQNIIGYCNSMDVRIRSRPDNMAVMLEEDGSQIWCHIPMDIWNEYLKRAKQLI